MKEYFAETAVMITDSDGHELANRDVPSIVTHEDRDGMSVTRIDFLEKIVIEHGQSLTIGDTLTH